MLLPSLIRIFVRRNGYETTRTAGPSAGLCLGGCGRRRRRRCDLHRRRAVRCAPCGRQFGRRHPPCGGVCASLRRAGARHAQYAALRRRTRGRRTAGPRTRRGGCRCAHRAGHGAAAHVAARRTARLDADGDPHACRGGVSGECGFRTRDSGTGAVARRDPCDLPRHDSRGRVFRPRCDLRGVQRSVLSVAVDVGAQRQSGRMQPAVPSELRSGRRRRKADPARQAPALGARSQSGRSAGGVDRRGRHLVQDRRTAQRRRLYPQRGGLLPPPARRGDRFARRLPPCVGGGDAARFHPRSGEEFHARRIGVFPYGAVGGCRVVRHAQVGGRVRRAGGRVRCPRLYARPRRRARCGRRYLHRCRRHERQFGRRAPHRAQPDACVDPPRCGGLSQSGQPVPPAIGAQPYAARHSCGGLRDGCVRPGDVSVYGLRGAVGGGFARGRVRACGRSREDGRRVADAGRPQRRYAVRRTAGGGDRCRVVRSSFAGRGVAARSAGGVAPAARRTGSRTPDSCRRPVCALSCCGAFGRRECYQPACGTFLPRPRGDAHRAGARPRSLDGGPAGDAFGLLHPSRDRRMPAGRFAPRRRSLSGARREALPAGVRLRTLRNEFDR